MPCLARYTTVKDKLYFGDGKHRFYMERCCGAPTEGTCPKCLVKNQIKVQDCRTFDHGVVDGPYPAKSQLYDSPYYHAGVAKYGAPNATDLEKAIEAQRMARGGKKPVESAPEPNQVEAKKKMVADKPKPKKEKTEGEKPKPKSRAKKEVVPVLVPPVEEAKPLVKLPDAPMESMDDPLPVTEVIKVVLKPFTIGQTTYWRDGEREKLYKKEGGKKGPYVGRWDHFTQSIIRDAPDSDSD